MGGAFTRIACAENTAAEAEAGGEDSNHYRGVAKSTLENAWDAFGKRKNGRVTFACTPQELNGLLPCAYLDRFPPNGGGLVDFLEVLCGVCVVCGEFPAEEKCRFLFQVFDFNATGQLSFEDAVLMMRSCAVGAAKLSRGEFGDLSDVEDQAGDLFEFHDLDRREEFVEPRHVAEWAELQGEVFDVLEGKAQDSLDEDRLNKMVDLDTFKRAGGHRRRNTVCAEPIQAAPADWKPTVHAKTPEQELRVAGIIGKNCLFQALDAEHQRIIVGAMEEKAFAAGAPIITQGDSGDFFYIVDQGECEIFVNGALVLESGPGDSFGELALLYDAPRAATVQARTAATCWALDRLSFKRLIQDFTVKQRSLYEGFLEKVPILEPLDKRERLTIADALAPQWFEAGEAIVAEGDFHAKHFYIVAEGEAKCTKEGLDGEACARLCSGAYFGELALITNAPRAATVTAVQRTKCLLLERSAFVRLLGPINDILARNAGLYARYEVDLGDKEAIRRMGGGSSRRKMVFAEAPTADADWVAPQHWKSEEMASRIREIVGGNILFSTLDAKQLQVVITAMKEERVAAGKAIIQQGASGDYFYILDEGTCDIFVEKDGKDELVMQAKQGDSFGELALLYDAPRAATVRATTDVKCWVLDRSSFKNILMDANLKERSAAQQLQNQLKVEQAQEAEMTAAAAAAEGKAAEAKE